MKMSKGYFDRTVHFAEEPQAGLVSEAKVNRGDLAANTDNVLLAAGRHSL